MKGLGELLRDRGWVSNHQLDEALARQREMGGLVGTCLLELGAIQEDLLVRVLSEQLGVPAASVADLADVRPAVHGLLPRDLAARYLAVPFRKMAGRVDVALLDVRNLALHDELAFVIGKKLNIHIANEARIYEALEKYYGQEPPVRFAHLLELLNRERGRWQAPAAKKAQKPAGKTVVSPAPARRPTPPPPVARKPVPPSRIIAHELRIESGEPPKRTPEEARPVSSGTAAVETRVHRTEPGAGAAAQPAASEPRPAPVIPEPVAPAPKPVVSATETPAKPRPIPPRQMVPKGARARPSRARLTLEEVELLLEKVRKPDEVGRVLLDYLAQQYPRVLLFRVQKNQITGWMGRGQSLNEARLRDYEVDFAQPSIFLNLRQGGSFFLGQLPDMPAHAKLAECWNETTPHECAVFPVRIRDRAVSYIYLDRDHRGLDGLDFTSIRRLATMAGIAFEMCIMQQKLRKV
ncbi:MAG: hypothetical protein EP299_00360 [Acidobacteria bacterium]|nr:MAG: hypothetical protein EP299_00360 [Acidobacteriota bacterium]